MYANTASSGWTLANVRLDRLQMTFSEVASPSVEPEDVLGGELALVRTEQLAISRTSLATAGSFRMGGG